MELNKKFLICGGDLRQMKMADNLAACGFDTAVYGFEDCVEFESNVKVFHNIIDALSGREIIVLPLPCSCDDETINMPMYNKKLNINELLRDITKNQIVVAGRVSAKIKKLAELYNIVITDYFEREELTVLNAIPTAEGAIQIAMQEMPITLHGSTCLILGFGRIGKLIAKSLYGLGAKVTVEARKFSDLAWIKAYGYEGFPLSKLNENLSKFDLIINTIPFKVLNEEMLRCVKNDVLIIDIASKPGGVDFDCAAKLGIKVIWALSLPGNVAPITAGIIIKDTVLNLLEELGV